MKRGADKWGKYKFMKASANLELHLPPTLRLTEDTFRSFMNTYSEVIVKPESGGGGAGVYRVRALADERYEIHKERNRTTVQDLQSAYTHLSRKIGSRKYIIQRRINLATVDNRPFDIRVIVQRQRKSSNWTVTGEIAKVAGKGFIVTNISRSKGRLLSLRSGIRRSSIRSLPVHSIISEIHRVALLAARRLQLYYPRQRIFGMDIGLDQQGHVWIIEANRAPSMSHFIKSGNRTMYRRIIRFKRGVS
ncbi:YheC/YheD family protein [Bacillus horti]|uniref:Glutathione synthase/RimK-type ligase-like ATP-grasp enzyme n=1 Tax=Caldalkalibacillus horti TaxID=77523 RepID=A0ABT9VZI7_9BACI|nr:YheC/YheD family protein [Bacillus horti]MDQ0166405.1 glutathione synthase/RimK-type ligase-like ATP-grasp enzyme [Bacillus horti]